MEFQRQMPLSRCQNLSRKGLLVVNLPVDRPGRRKVSCCSILLAL